MFREMPPDDRAATAINEEDVADWEPGHAAGDRDRNLNELLESYAAAVVRTAEEGGSPVLD